MEQILADLQLPLYRYFVRLSNDPDLSADLTQETLLRAWARQKQLRVPGAARVWAFGIATNLWRDRCRSLAKTRCDEIADDQPSREDNPFHAAVATELGDAVWNAIGTLPERQRQILHLRVVEQMEPKQIAESLELTPKLVRSNLSAARKNLRARLTEHLCQSGPEEKSS